MSAPLLVFLSAFVCRDFQSKSRLRFLDFLQISYVSQAGICEAYSKASLTNRFRVRGCELAYIHQSYIVFMCSTVWVRKMAAGQCAHGCWWGKPSLPSGSLCWQNTGMKMPEAKKQATNVFFVDICSVLWTFKSRGKFYTLQKVFKNHSCNCWVVVFMIDCRCEGW